MPADQTTFLSFAAQAIAERLESLSLRLGAVRAEPSPEAVRALRVAGRRMLTAVDCFRAAVDGPELRDLKQQVRRLMKGMQEVRDRDVALRLAAEAGLTDDSDLIRTLDEQRQTADSDVQALINRDIIGEFESALRRRQRSQTGLDQAKASGPVPESQ